jgi:ligand-binding SRPBCC domain-containing protein
MRDYFANPIIESIVIHASIERCFALSTRVELVHKTLGMNLVDGITTGHIAANARVVWRGRKFGLMTEHHTLITAFEPPQIIDFPSGPAKAAFFQDSQERGRFASFRHDHFFRENIVDGQPQTLLRDEIHFALPFGLLGKAVAKLIMEPHIKMLARTRFAMLKQLAEGDGWCEWIANDATFL